MKSFMSTSIMIIASEAVSFFGFSSCNSFIAFNPIGVAALSSPRMLADTFRTMLPDAGCPFGMPGNMREKSGLIHLPNLATSPAFSPIFMSPNQKVSTPVSPRQISNAFCDDSKVQFISRDQISASPPKMDWQRAAMKAIAKKENQM